jgi:hypothetical protein
LKKEIIIDPRAEKEIKAFQKKQQRTPLQVIKKALNRLKIYLKS